MAKADQSWTEDEDEMVAKADQSRTINKGEAVAKADQSNQFSSDPDYLL